MTDKKEKERKNWRERERKKKQIQSRLLLSERKMWSQVKRRLTEQVRPLFPHLLCFTFLMPTQYDLQDSTL